MEQKEQVRDEPVTGQIGENKNDAPKEDINSSTESSENKEDKSPAAENDKPDLQEAVLEEKDTHAPESKPPAESGSETDPPLDDFDYSTLSREDLVNRLEVLIETKPVNEIRRDVDHIKINFYKKAKIETEKRRKKFVEEGGAIEDFQPGADPLEIKVKELFKKFRDIKAEFNKNLELVKQDNLRKKYDVIEKIKDLINSKESINKTFQDFRDLQKEWRSIGLVPQRNLKDLWDTYNHNVEKFYDYIKINQELRDLDLKKNLELKIQLCEKAEMLLLESSVVHAFNLLQKYHERWREIGPVPREHRTEIWERFKETTSKINKKHQQYFEELKKAQKKNLEQKAILCEKAEELSNLALDNHKQWDGKSQELIELQKVWKSIGFAPKKDNNKIYERFRTACDTFFSRKREFYARNREDRLNNLQLKTDLCVQAEAMKDNTNWKKTTEDFISLQKKWKKIGPVPNKHSDAVWKRFRAACDYFFNRKSEHYKNVDESYYRNLEEKNKLLKEVREYKISGNAEENFRALNDFQRRWSEIGFVPIKEKDDLQEKFRKAINAQFDKLDINDSMRNMLKFKNKVNNILQKPNAEMKLNHERERFVNRLQQLKNDIILWENNIGFFARSKNAESMIEEVQNKIDKAREAIQLLEQKVDMIDNLDRE